MSDLATLRSQLDACIAEVLAVARTAASTSRAEWAAITEAMIGQPPGELPAAGAGANPAEVREVLLAVEARYERRLAALERARQDDDDAIWEFRHRRLDRIVAEELVRYIEAVAPRPSVASAFARAARPKPIAAAPARVQIHRCKTCGAPRLSAGLYGDCVYCGQPFFTGSNA
jgi:hypothetical protein